MFPQTNPIWIRLKLELGRFRQNWLILAQKLREVITQFPGCSSPKGSTTDPNGSEGRVKADALTSFDLATYHARQMPESQSLLGQTISHYRIMTKSWADAI
jgi:hypothetical protein